MGANDDKIMIEQFVDRIIGISLKELYEEDFFENAISFVGDDSTSLRSDDNTDENVHENRRGNSGELETEEGEDNQIISTDGEERKSGQDGNEAEGQEQEQEIKVKDGKTNEEREDESNDQEEIYKNTGYDGGEIEKEEIEMDPEDDEKEKAELKSEQVEIGKENVDDKRHESEDDEEERDDDVGGDEIKQEQYVGTEEEEEYTENEDEQLRNDKKEESERENEDVEQKEVRKERDEDDGIGECNEHNEMDIYSDVDEGDHENDDKVTAGIREETERKLEEGENKEMEMQKGLFEKLEGIHIDIQKVQEKEGKESEENEDDEDSETYDEACPEEIKEGVEEFDNDAGNSRELIKYEENGNDADDTRKEEEKKREVDDYQIMDLEGNKCIGDNIGTIKKEKVNAREEVNAQKEVSKLKEERETLDVLNLNINARQEPENIVQDEASTQGGKNDEKNRRWWRKQGENKSSARTSSFWRWLLCCGGNGDED